MKTEKKKEEMRVKEEVDGLVRGRMSSQQSNNYVLKQPDPSKTTIT